jgi:hypothetical protein
VILVEGALPTLTERETPSRGKRQVKVGCRVSSAGLDLAALTSRVGGGGFASAGGLRPGWSRMRRIDNSSVMYATILSGPPQPLQTISLREARTRLA